jgi:hypothetical protein
MCYNYPWDVISILVCSVILNGILGISLAKRISAHNRDILALNDIIKSLRKRGWYGKN